MSEININKYSDPTGPSDFPKHQGGECTNWEIPHFSLIQQKRRAANFLKAASWRRTIRHFESAPVSDDVVTECLKAAINSPSGANRQPFLFVVVTNQKIKSQIRAAAERVERKLYFETATEEFLEALRPLNTNASKPHLEEASHLIVVFTESYSFDQAEKRRQNYYVKESTGISVGVLISALNFCGLGTLTHTPTPSAFLNDILGIETRFRPFLILAVGKPRLPIIVPKIEKRGLDSLVRIMD